MISVRLDTGQTVTFDDGTDEDTIKSVMAHVEAGTYGHLLALDPTVHKAQSPETDPFANIQAGSSSTARRPGPKYDLSHVTGNGPVPVPAANSAGIRLKLAEPSLDFSDVMSGSSTSDPTAAKRAELAQVAATGDINRGRRGMDPDADLHGSVDVASEFLSGLPARTYGAVSNAVTMPVRAGESVLKGVAGEIQNLGSDRPSTSTGAGFAKGFTRQWGESGAGRGADLIQRELVDPAQQRLLDANIKAGMSPIGAALTDTGQAATAEALNPVNYIAPHELIAGLRGADAVAPAALRAAELEAQGGARGLEQAGVVAREYGGHSAPSEIAQGKIARSGAYLPGAREPLVYLDRLPAMEAAPVPTSGVLGPIKGALPDAIGEALGKPWRTYNDTIPLERPGTVAPKPRMVERDPLPLPPVQVMGNVSDDQIRNVAGQWDYASRRYPAIAGQVKNLKLSSADAYYDFANKELAIPPDADLGLMMHELTHAAQGARGQTLPDVGFEGRAAALEPYSARAEEVYRRIPQPQPKDLSAEEIAALRGPSSAPGGSTQRSIPASQSPLDRPVAFHEVEAALARGVEPISPGFGGEHEAAKYATWLDRAGMEPTGQLANRYFDIHNPDPGLDFYRAAPSDLSAGEQARLAAGSSPPGVGPSLTGQHADSPISGPMSLANDPVRDVFGSSPNGAEWQRLTDRMKQLPRGALLDATASQEKNAIMNRLSEIEAPLSDDQVNHLYGEFNDTFPMRDLGTGIQSTRLSDQQIIRMTEDGRVVRKPAKISAAANANVPVPTGPQRVYAGGPPPPAPLSEADTAAAMGWAHPLNQPGSPNAIIDPIHLTRPDGSAFQTNFAAQLGPKNGPLAAQWVVEHSNEIFRRVGPPQTYDTVEMMASMSGTTPEEFLRDNPRWNTLSPEERLRMGMIANGSFDRVSEIQGKIANGTATVEEKAELLRETDNYGNYIKMAAGSASDYARALNSCKIEARMSLGNDFVLKQQVYRRYAAQLDKEKPMMDALARLDPKNPDELQAFLRQVNKPKVREFMQEIYVNSILSSPVPFTRKVIGDTIMMLGENGLVRPLGAVFDAARGGIAGGAKSIAAAGTAAERDMFIQEASASFIGLGRGVQKGFRQGLEVLSRGYDPRLSEGNALFVPRSAFARAESSFVRNVVGPFMTMPTRIISAATTMARTMNFTAELYAQAARVAAKEELLALRAGTGVPDTAGRIAGLIANPTDEMLTAAGKFAGRATFTDETSALGKKLIEARDLPGITSQHAIGNAGLETYRALGGFLLPFVHIADRLMVRGLEYTPLGFASAVGERSIGNYAESASAAARASIGSMVMAYAASLAFDGRLIGAAPSDRAERAAFYAAGKQPFSFITNSGEVIPFGHMQPIAMPLAIVAAMHDGWTMTEKRRKTTSYEQGSQNAASAGQLPTPHGGEGENDTASIFGKIMDGAVQVGAHITDQSYLLTLSKIMDVIHGTEQGRAGHAATDILAGTAFGMAPYSALTRTIAKTIDPRVIDDRTLSGKILQNVPVASLGLMGKLDPWGEEVVPQGGRVRTFLASGTPLLSSQLTPQPLDNELARLGMPLGYVGSTISDHKKQVKLSDDEHFQYQQLAGRASKLTIGAVIAREGYSDLDTEVQRSQITQAIGAARKYARIVTLRAHNNASNYLGLNPDLGSINMVNESARE